MIDKKKYEEYFNEYKLISESLKSNNLSLEESINKYKESKEIYSKLKEILDQAKLEIESIKE